jgi:hypothetical protein
MESDQQVKQVRLKLHRDARCEECVDLFLQVRRWRRTKDGQMPRLIELVAARASIPGGGTNCALQLIVSPLCVFGRDKTRRETVEHAFLLWLRLGWSFG